MPNQEKFLQGVNSKDPHAWKELYRSFYGALCNHAIGIVSDKTVAEDIVQECFITIWNTSLYFPQVQALTAYLYRSVHNNALKYLRDKTTDDARLQKWYEEQEEVEDSYFYQAIEEELIRKLREKIVPLPEQRKTILLLSIDGLSIQEIAEQLNISVNTVKTQKKRAYAYLKKHLQGGYLILFILEILK